MKEQNFLDAYLPKTILVTGGAGFIGSCFVRQTLQDHPDTRVVNLDLLTYAGNLDNLEDIADDPRHVFVRGDILDGPLVAYLIETHRIDSIVHFAAESHVDRSIHDASPFVRTNVEGTLTLLQCARAANIARFVQIGTDEVYGALALDSEEKFREDTPLTPNSPYSASKAGADLLAASFCHTFELPVLITRCSNNYGPRQFPEKLIPLMIRNALADKPLPVYGDGLYVRDWIHVEDHAAAVWTVLTRGRAGQIYNIGADGERPNIEVIRAILERLGKPESLMQRVEDRLGHDRRYALDASKIRNELGWRPVVDFDAGIASTIEWYRENARWLERIATGAYREARA